MVKPSTPTAQNSPQQHEWTNHSQRQQLRGTSPHSAHCRTPLNNTWRDKTRQGSSRCCVTTGRRWTRQLPRTKILAVTGASSASETSNVLVVILYYISAHEGKLNTIRAKDLTTTFLHLGDEGSFCLVLQFCCSILRFILFERPSHRNKETDRSSTRQQAHSSSVCKGCTQPGTSQTPRA